MIFTVLSKGHRVSPVMHTRYERLLRLTRLARRPGVTQVFSQVSGSQKATRPGRARWGARSRWRPPLAGTRTRARAAGTSRGKSTSYTSCRSPYASSNSGSGTAFVAFPCASLRRGALSASGDWATRRTARPDAWHCGSPPASWRSR